MVKKNEEFKGNNMVVVADAGWADIIPGWLLSEISGTCNTVKPEKREETVGDAGVIAYLMTASLRAPLEHGHTEIYLPISKSDGKSLESD